MAKVFALKQHLSTDRALRPDIRVAAPLLLTEWRRLTPDDYDRNVFHVELDVGGSQLEDYPDGSALSVYAQNAPEVVSLLLSRVGLAEDEILTLDEGDAHFVTTAGKLLRSTLDVQGEVSTDVLKGLYHTCDNVYEKVQMAELTLDRNADRLIELKKQGLSILDLLKLFPSCKPTAKQLADICPRIKQRVCIP